MKNYLVAKSNKTETLSDVITQTDRDGKPKNRISTGTSNTTSTVIISLTIKVLNKNQELTLYFLQQVDSEDSSSSENSIFSYLCCCFYRDDRKSSRSTELTRPSSARNPIT